MNLNFPSTMRRGVLLVALFIPLVVQAQLSWFGDTSAQSGQTYTVGASGSYQSITIYKNGSYFTSGSYGVGASTSDTGPATISYRADGSGSYGSSTIYRSVSISGPNHAPSASIGGTTSLTLSGGSATGSWSFAASDSDGNLYRWRVSLAPNVARWTSISGSSQSSSFSYTFTSAGTYTFNLDVEDTNGASASDSVTVVVEAAPAYYSLSVVSGSGDGSYLANQNAYISANSPPSDYEFWHWKRNYGPGYLWYDWQSSTDFTMGAGAAEVEAVYQVITHYLSVIDGTGSGYYASGSSVHIVANPASNGQHFTGWSLDSGHGSFQNASSPDTYFNSSAWDSTVRANYAVTEYALTVVGGSGSGSYAPGQVVEIRANDAPGGTTFSYWSISGPGSVQQSASMLTRFTMGSGNATVTAVYDTLYTLSVTNGKVNGASLGYYISGTSVTLVADAPPAGQSFSQWTLVGPGSIGTPTASSSSFTTGAGNATVTATFVLLAPTISTHPLNQTVTAGTGASFTVVVSSADAVSYQWQCKPSGSSSFANLVNGGIYSGVTSASLAVNPTAATMNGDQFRVVATNSVGSVTSNVATLTVSSPPVITSQPQSQTVVAGGSVIFVVIATGTPPPTYQWRKNGTNLANGGNVSGATSAALSLTNVQAVDAAAYSVVITNSTGNVTSGNATLTIGSANELIKLNVHLPVSL